LKRNPAITVQVYKSRADHEDASMKQQEKIKDDQAGDVVLLQP